MSFSIDISTSSGLMPASWVSIITLFLSSYMSMAGAKLPFLEMPGCWSFKKLFISSNCSNMDGVHLIRLIVLFF